MTGVGFKRVHSTLVHGVFGRSDRAPASLQTGTTISDLQPTQLAEPLESPAVEPNVQSPRI